VQIVVGRPYADGDRQVTRVSCGGQYGSCTFSEKYALEAR
jgi:hypothetical protein